jgi:hypothetical protein
MTTQAAGPQWCPRCLRGVGEAARCPSCGLPQLGADAARLRVVVRRLSDIAEQQRALGEETSSLRWEQGRLLQALAAQGAWAAQGGRTAPRAGREWRPEMVRGVLLWLGSALVALAALIFAVVAWIRLGETGRAGLLVGVTLLAALGTLAARRRLPATAEALGALTLALVLVDWYAARRAGVAAGWSVSAWWALGTATSAAVAAAAGPWLWVQRPLAAVLAQASAVLVVATIADLLWTAGVGLALVAAAGVAAATTLAGNRSWRAAATALGAGAGLLELAALGLAFQLSPVEDNAGAVRLAAVFAAMALAPAVARASLNLPPGRVVLDALVALTVAALLASAGALLAGQLSSWALLAGLAVLGAAAVTLARALPRALQRGAAVAAAAMLAVAVVGLLGPLLRALVAPLAWVGDPWTTRLTFDAAVAVQRLPLAQGGLDGLGPAVVMLLACVAAAGAAAARVHGARLVAPWPAAATALGAATGVMALLPLAAGWPLWAALASVAAGALAAAAAAVLSDRAGREHAAGALVACAAVLLVLAVGWALASEAGTLVLAAVLIPVGALVAGVSRGAWLRCCGAAVASAAVVGESAAIVASTGAATAQVGLAVAVAAAAVLVAGALWRRHAVEGPVMESVGNIGLVLGILLAGAEQRWLAIALTAAAPLLLAAAARPDRRAYAWCAAAVAVVATWAWLRIAGVSLPEAYTLPAAAVALLAGALARRRAPQLSSWLAFGPGLAAALLPSLGLAIDQDGVARPLLLTAGALLVVLAGARARLQAPLVLGAVTLVVLGVDAVWPVAAQLPRWAMIGAAGLLLLWLGATAERRLGQLRELRQRLQSLERDGTAEAPR